MQMEKLRSEDKGWRMIEYFVHCGAVSAGLISLGDGWIVEIVSCFIPFYIPEPSPIDLVDVNMSLCFL